MSRDDKRGIRELQLLGPSILGALFGIGLIGIGETLPGILVAIAFTILSVIIFIRFKRV
jgi:hypothetical protein